MPLHKVCLSKIIPSLVRPNISGPSSKGWAVCQWPVIHIAARHYLHCLPREYFSFFFQFLFSSFLHCTLQQGFIYIATLLDFYIDRLLDCYIATRDTHCSKALFTLLVEGILSEHTLSLCIRMYPAGQGENQDALCNMQYACKGTAYLLTS